MVEKESAMDVVWSKSEVSRLAKDDVVCVMRFKEARDRGMELGYWTALNVKTIYQTNQPTLRSLKKSLT